MLRGVGAVSRVGGVLAILEVVLGSGDLGARVGGQELRERRRDVVVGDRLIVNVEMREDGLVESAPGFVACPDVELVRISKQLEAKIDVLRSLP